MIIDAIKRSAQLKVAIFLLIAILLGIVINTIIIYPKLPEKVAIHFDGNGQADNYSTKVKKKKENSEKKISSFFF